MDAELQAALEPVFAENFTERGELGASVSVWRDGAELVHLDGGWRDRGKTAPWDARTLVSGVLGHERARGGLRVRCLEEAGIALATPVAIRLAGICRRGQGRDLLRGNPLASRRVWPPWTDPPDVFDYPAVIHALENSIRSGRRATGTATTRARPDISGMKWCAASRACRWEITGGRRMAEPLGLDFWIGLPPERLPDVATMVPARMAPAEDDFLQAFSDPDSLTHRAFASPQGLLASPR